MKGVTFRHRSKKIAQFLKSCTAAPLAGKENIEKFQITIQYMVARAPNLPLLFSEIIHSFYYLFIRSLFVTHNRYENPYFKVKIANDAKYYNVFRVHVHSPRNSKLMIIKVVI